MRVSPSFRGCARHARRANARGRNAGIFPGRRRPSDSPPSANCAARDTKKWSFRRNGGDFLRQPDDARPHLRCAAVAPPARRPLPPCAAFRLSTQCFTLPLRTRCSERAALPMPVLEKGKPSQNSPLTSPKSTYMSPPSGRRLSLKPLASSARSSPHSPCRRPSKWPHPSSRTTSSSRVSPGRAT